MILLDTNILSELMRPAPEKGVEQWLADQPDASVFISAVTEGELRYGVALLPPGKRRSTLAAVIDDRAADSAFFSFAQAAAFVICRASAMGA